MAERGSDVVAVVVTYRSGRDIGACLAALGMQLRSTDRLGVVDNASPDDSGPLVEQALREQIGLPEWSYRASPVNEGFGHACNRGAAAWPGRDVLLVNPDAVLAPGALDAMRSVLEADRDYGAVGPRIVRFDGAPEAGARRSLPRPAVAFGRLSHLDRIMPQRFGSYHRLSEDPLAEADIDAGSGCCVLVRREAWDGLGGFDPRFFMYGEDLDLFLRLQQSGWKMRYEPSALVVHRKAGSTDQRRARMIIEFHRAMWTYYCKHHLRGITASLAPLVLVGLTGRTVAQLAGCWVGTLSRRLGGAPVGAGDSIGEGARAGLPVPESGLTAVPATLPARGRSGDGGTVTDPPTRCHNPVSTASPPDHRRLSGDW